MTWELASTYMALASIPISLGVIVHCWNTNRELGRRIAAERVRRDERIAAAMAWTDDPRPDAHPTERSERTFPDVADPRCRGSEVEGGRSASL